jgi:hypothetical protein
VAGDETAPVGARTRGDGTPIATAAAIHSRRRSLMSHTAVTAAITI